MAFWQARDFLFCGVCGTLLTFDSVRSASCPLCGFKRDAKEIEGKQIQYTMTAEDIRRGLKTPTEDIVVQRPLTNKSCKNCDHPEAEYYSLQMRSADEGETIFYTCTKCGLNFKED
ncbi:uncharacterized protein [Miscanthus floridulus]|uniref:uncharacterized protein n=1 Tax=Miscanthus floridulus TaxID=154761 RepID=UPI00345B391C